MVRSCGFPLYKLQELLLTLINELQELLRILIGELQGVAAPPCCELRVLLLSLICELLQVLLLFLVCDLLVLLHQLICNCRCCYNPSFVCYRCCCPLIITILQYPHIIRLLAFLKSEEDVTAELYLVSRPSSVISAGVYTKTLYKWQI
jgi:hypothetical protein